jgi:hypothetical protein
MGQTFPAVEYVPDGFLVPLDEGAEQRLSQAADFKGLSKQDFREISSGK